MAREDAAMTRLVRAQIARRNVDSSMLDIRVIHGIVYLRGVLRLLRTHAYLDLSKEMEIISTILRSKTGIREVVWETVLRS